MLTLAVSISPQREAQKRAAQAAQQPGAWQQSNKPAAPTFKEIQEQEEQQASKQGGGERQPAHLVRAPSSPLSHHNPASPLRLTAPSPFLSLPTGVPAEAHAGSGSGWWCPGGPNPFGTGRVEPCPRQCAPQEEPARDPGGGGTHSTSSPKHNLASIPGSTIRLPAADQVSPCP